LRCGAHLAVTSGLFGCRWARRSYAVTSRGELPCAHAGTTAACGRAIGPCAPGTHRAVHAGNRRASRNVGQSRARCAARRFRLAYGSRPLGGSDSARCIALCPRTPRAHCAISRARMQHGDETRRTRRRCCAGTNLGRARACDAASRGRRANGADPCMRPSAACDRARAPHLPCTVGAVAWADHHNAAASLSESGAGGAAAAIFCSYSASPARSASGATAHRASRPFAPCTDGAVDGAQGCAALRVLMSSWAARSQADLRPRHHPCTGGRACITAARAGAP
jgi:hypothetical protein